MSTQYERELRRTVAEGLAALNEHNGGRFLSAVARTVGVDRTTVGRWSKQLTTASVEHCRALAKSYPDFFDGESMVELHANSALAPSDAFAPTTVGADVLDGSAAVFRAAADAILSDPGPPENRVFKLASLHVERLGADALSSDPFVDDETKNQTERFRQAMAVRAGEGWHIRIVVATASAVRLHAIWQLVKAIDGPNVQIGAYPIALPHVLSALLIANRETILSIDSPRFERPESAVVLRSRPIMKWADTYYSQLHQDAPYTLRSVHGPSEKGLDALRRHIAARP